MDIQTIVFGIIGIAILCYSVFRIGMVFGKWKLEEKVMGVSHYSGQTDMHPVNKGSQASKMVIGPIVKLCLLLQMIPIALFVREEFRWGGVILSLLLMGSTFLELAFENRSYRPLFWSLSILLFLGAIALAYLKEFVYMPV